MICNEKKLSSEDLNQFQSLLDKTVIKLSVEKKNLEWKSFEKDVLQAIKAVQEENYSENYSNWNATLFSGKSFPDITLQINSNQHFGIEVKTTHSNNWKALGGSIMESTRIEGVERISVILAKWNPFEVRHKSFEDCVSDVAVTHSPRYVLNLDINKNESIFKKINATYEEIRNSKTPYDFFKPYFLDKAKKNKNSLWFISNDEQQNPDELPKLEIQFYNQLPLIKKNELLARAFILFPEILKEKADYKEASVWLLKKGIINSSIRDMFSAGKRCNLLGYDVPKKYQRLYESLDRIKFSFNSAENQFEVFEKFNNSDINNIKFQWLNQVKLSSKNVVDPDFINRFLKRFDY